MKKGVLIYPDSNNKSGMGHIMRCLNLAAFFVKYFDVFIILDNDINIDKHLLNGLKVFRSKEIFKDISFFIKNNIRIYIYDNYSNEIEYSLDVINNLENYLKVFHLCDDLKDIKYRNNLNPFINFIMPNIISKNIFSKAKLLVGDKFFGGNDFIILNDIWRSKISTSEIPQKFHDFFLSSNFHILFSLGNAELDNSLLWEEKLSPFLRTLSNNFINSKVIALGTNAFNFLKKNNVKCYKYLNYCDFKSLHYLYQISDLYIGSIGYSMWERCAMKLPSFLVPIAENQIEYLNVALDLKIGMSLDYIISDNKSFFEQLDFMRENCNRLEFNMKGYQELFSQYDNK